MAYSNGRNSGSNLVTLKAEVKPMGNIQKLIDRVVESVMRDNEGGARYYLYSSGSLVLLAKRVDNALPIDVKTLFNVFKGNTNYTAEGLGVLTTSIRVDSYLEKIVNFCRGVKVSDRLITDNPRNTGNKFLALGTYPGRENTAECMMESESGYVKIPLTLFDLITIKLGNAVGNRSVEYSAIRDYVKYFDESITFDDVLSMVDLTSLPAYPAKTQGNTEPMKTDKIQFLCDVLNKHRKEQKVTKENVLALAKAVSTVANENENCLFKLWIPKGKAAQVNITPTVLARCNAQINHAPDSMTLEVICGFMAPEQLLCCCVGQLYLNLPENQARKEFIESYLKSEPEDESLTFDVWSNFDGSIGDKYPSHINIEGETCTYSDLIEKRVAYAKINQRLKAMRTKAIKEGLGIQCTKFNGHTQASFFAFYLAAEPYTAQVSKGNYKSKVRGIYTTPNAVKAQNLATMLGHIQRHFES